MGKSRGIQRLITNDKEEASLIPTTVSSVRTRLDVCTHLTQRARNRTDNCEHKGDPRREGASNNSLQLRPSKVRRDPCKAWRESELFFRWRRIFFPPILDSVAARRTRASGVCAFTLQFLLGFDDGLGVAPMRVVGG